MVMIEIICRKASKCLTTGILALSLGMVGIMGLVAAQPESAGAVTVGPGISWNYGRNAGVYAYSSVFSSVYSHSATVHASNGAHDYSGANPGYQAYAEIWVAPWDSVEYYWNYW